MKLAYAAKPPSAIAWFFAPSPAGRLMVAANNAHEIVRVAFMRGSTEKEIIAQWQKQWPATVIKRGEAVRAPENPSIRLTGTPFQYAVWQAMAKIPLGKTLGYGALAAKIGNPRAARAIGAACGANPVPYYVPCHRVVAQNGLGGFSGGKADVSIKIDLLKAEGVALYPCSSSVSQ